MRTCKKCGKSKSIEDFPRHNCGYRHSCKECSNLARHAWIEANPASKEKDKAAKKAWRKNNPDKAKAAIAEWRKTNKHKECAKTARYLAKKRMATIRWLSDTQKTQIEWFYLAAKMMTETTGIKHEVDHIHPLQGSGFTGLHVPWNLQVIPKRLNQSKGNKLI
jgi:hypothetical protein